MGKLVNFFCVALINATIFFASHTAFSLNSGTVYVDGSVVDFGTIRISELSERKTLSRKIKMTNRGPDKVSILQIATSCGCATARPSKTILLGGQESELEVFIDTEGRSGRNLAQVIVGFSNGEHIKIDLKYDIEVGGKLFPPQVIVKKSKGKAGQFSMTAYLSFPEKGGPDGVPRMDVSCEDSRIRVVTKSLQFASIPNELTGHYNCMVSFEGLVDSDVSSFLGNCTLTQDGIIISSSRLRVVETGTTYLLRNSIYLGYVKRNHVTNVELKVRGASGFSNPFVKIPGYVEDSLKLTKTDEGLNIHFKVMWEGTGLTTHQGVFGIGSGENLRFTCSAILGD